MSTELTAELLRELLHYESTTGKFTRIKATNGRYGRIGHTCGTLDTHGYISVTIGCRKYAAHRLAWLYVHGQWPDNFIDHENGVRTDNRIQNLRDISLTGNAQNRRVPAKTNACGFLGVTASGRKFRAWITVAGKPTHLGTFESPDQAHQAYVAAKRKHHAGCSI